mmetsp:Transcript_130265/g.236755  ORF Transcript_130265/g.236755 Transcript_130265/m.236755 type:complete len:197 (+) Transcript_130265:3-593(+)
MGSSCCTPKDLSGERDVAAAGSRALSEPAGNEVVEVEQIDPSKDADVNLDGAASNTDALRKFEEEEGAKLDKFEEKEVAKLDVEGASPKTQLSFTKLPASDDDARTKELIEDARKKVREVLLADQAKMREMVAAAKKPLPVSQPPTGEAEANKEEATDAQAAKKAVEVEAITAGATTGENPVAEAAPENPKVESAS